MLMMTRHLVPISRLRRKLLLFATSWIALLSLTVNAASQAGSVSNTSVAKPKALAFEVVSIRPSKPGSPEGGSMGITPNGYRAMHQSLWTTIMVAYYPQGFEYWSRDRLLGGPPWLGTLYDIDARVSSADMAECQKQGRQKDMLHAMLRTLLAERCKLVIHSTTTEAPIYELVVGKQGAKLSEATPGAPVPSGSVRFPEGGGMVPYRSGEKPEVRFFDLSMTSLAANLSRSSTRPILDKTGLTGRYDFAITMRNDEGESASDPVSPTHWQIEKLGLTLKPAKAPIETLVVDHIERPSSN
jgi:uncharacterized protein (TIGR03435 family)